MALNAYDWECVYIVVQWRFIAGSAVHGCSELWWRRAALSRTDICLNNVSRWWQQAFLNITQYGQISDGPSQFGIMRLSIYT